MSMMKLKNNEAATQAAADHFARLPDEVFLSILSRLDELKFLCQCTLVSKRFASTIYCIPSITLTLPSIEMQSTVSVEDIYKLYRQILDVTSDEIPPLIRASPIQALKFFSFLHNFKELKSIHLEFVCSRNLSRFSPLAWKAKYRSSDNGVESLVSLVASSVRVANEDKPDEEHDPTHFSESHVRDSMLFPVKCCREWVVVLSLLMKCHSSLRSVVIKDTEKYGKLEVRGEQLVEWRKKLLCGEARVFDYFKLQSPGVCWLHELYLPMSGRLLTGVCFVVVAFVPGLDVSLEDVDMMDWECEGMLGEAVKEISMNHRHCFFRYLELPDCLVVDTQLNKRGSGHYRTRTIEAHSAQGIVLGKPWI